MYILSKKIAVAVKNASDAEGITITHDDGITKTIEHFTLHVFPRYKKDKICGHYVRDKDPGDEIRKIYASKVRNILIEGGGVKK